MLALVGPCAAFVRPLIALVGTLTTAATLAFVADALVGGALDGASNWRRFVALLVRVALSGPAHVVGATLCLLFVLAMAEAHHALPYAAGLEARLELGVGALAFLCWRAFAVVGGAGRRSLSEEALRGQALRQQATFSMLLDEKDAELTRLRVELAAVRKVIVTREDSLRTLRQQASSQSLELVKMMAQTLELKEQLSDQDGGHETLARKKEL
ncbi:hypothetical protein KFE25_007868 [Diacronema lutheri]|mgnify:CR=1 FL=1|uniref:Uncharacterized protein n=1 Tax=Diacronema lutheri TaxID=2081491 RepID=A0A8J5XWP7_DIALT|nr:hypothetical protein KFE25_007868 [Diacronema lutheri]